MNKVYFTKKYMLNVKNVKNIGIFFVLYRIMINFAA